VEGVEEGPTEWNRAEGVEDAYLSCTYLHQWIIIGEYIPLCMVNAGRRVHTGGGQKGEP
jgi:hypothetical protein